MACRTETKQIGEREFSVTQWPASKAMLMKLKLVKAFGVSLTKLASSTSDQSKGKKKEEQEIAALSDGLASLFESNSPEELVALMRACIEGVACDGKRITQTSIDEVFSPDDLIEIYKVFIFVIQVNYGNFLKGQWADNLLAKVKESL